MKDEIVYIQKLEGNKNNNKNNKNNNYNFKKLKKPIPNNVKQKPLKK
jgi:hypothetical protein